MSMRGGLVTALLLLAVLLSTSFTSVSADGFELSYDDGDYDYGWSDFYPLAAAVRFSPPCRPWKLRAIVFYGACYLRGPDGYFYVEICDQNLNVVYQSSRSFYSTFAERNATLDWHTIEMPDLIVGGDFYVLIAPSLTLDGPMLWIGADQSPPIDNRSLSVDIGSHIVAESFGAESRKPKDLMIRAVGEPAAASPELRLVFIEVNEGFTEVAFNVLGASVVDARANLSNTDRPAVGVVCDVSKSSADNSSFVVYVPASADSGLLSVCALTEFGTVSTSLNLGGELRTRYNELSERLRMANNASAAMAKEADKLRSENSRLREASEDKDELIFKLNNKLNAVEENNTRLSEEIASLKNEVGFLRAALASSIAVIVVLLLFTVRGRWRVLRGGSR